MTKLFKKEKVVKFFNILDKLSMMYPVDLSNYPWKDYRTIYTEDSKHIPSEREVFVNRTINKWLKGKYLIIYKMSDLGIQYKQYINISRLSYSNSWEGGYISVGVFDYSKPYNIGKSNDLQFKRNDVLDLEGEWCNTSEKHLKIMNLLLLTDVPEKEYVFKAFDFSKFPKRIGKNESALKAIETTKSVIAKTENQAYKLKREFEIDSLEHKGQLSIGELIEVKPIK